MEIWHRVAIDGKDLDFWRARGLQEKELRPIATALYEDGIAKAWLTDISESSELWPEMKAYIGNEAHFVTTFFSDEERLAADWCILRGMGPIRPLSPVGGYWSAGYYEGKCPVCGSGWTQIAPFHLAKEPKLGRNAFGSFGSAYELFAIDEVFRVFESEGIRGVDSWPILVGKDRHPGLGVKQLLVKSLAEPALAIEFAEHEKFRPADCSACGPTSYMFYSRGMLPLHRSALRTDVDFQMTYEWYGSGRAARHEILVTRRVVELILSRKWRGVDLSPVKIV